MGEFGQFGQFGMAPVVILLLITISFSSVTGLKCWECHDDFSPDDPSPEFCKNGPGVEKDCSKFDSCDWRALTNGEVYSRGCSWGKAEEVGCKPLKVGQQYEERTECICKTDLCNGGAAGSISSEQQQQSEESNSNNPDKKINGTNAADGDKNGSSSASCSLPLIMFGALGVIATRKFKFPLIFGVLIALASFSSVSGLKCYSCIDKSDKSVNLCADGKIGMEADCEEGTKTCIYTKKSTEATEIELGACGDAIDHEQEPGSCVPHVTTTTVVLCSCATDLCNGNPLQNSQHSSDSADSTSSSTSSASLSLLKIPTLFLVMAPTLRFCSFWAY